MVWRVVAKEADKMRNTLEDHITPGKQQITPNSELKRTADRVTRFESQLTEWLDEEGKSSVQKRALRSLRQNMESYVIRSRTTF